MIDKTNIREKLYSAAVRLSSTVDNMKLLGFRSAFVSTEENADAGNKAPQTTVPKLFYIVCYALLFFLIPSLSN